jgi:hypothetical protein
MRKRSIATSICLLSCLVTGHQTVLGGETAPAAGAVDVPAYQAKYAGCEGVYLYVEQKLEHYGASESKVDLSGGSWSFITSDRRKYVVLDPEQEHLTSIRLESKPDSLCITILSPDGRVRTYGKTDLKEEKLTGDYKLYTLVYPDIVAGTVIQEEYYNRWTFGGSSFFGSIFGSLGYPLLGALSDRLVGFHSFGPPLEHEIPLQFPIPCERLSVTFTYPDSWKVKVKNISRDGLLPAIYEHDFKGRRQIIRYDARNVNAVKDEPFSPFSMEMAKYFALHITELKVKDKVLFERVRDWQDIADPLWLYACSLSDKQLSRTKDTTVRVVANCRTQYDKADAIITYVQDNFTLSEKSLDGDMGKILKLRQGNSFDLLLLSRAMLTQAGVRNWPIFVHSAEHGYFDPDYFDIEQLDVPAIRVKLDSLDYVVFPYIKHVPIDHVPEDLQGQRALQIDKGIASLWRLPEGNRAENITTEQYELTINADGSIGVSEHRSIRGYQAHLMRERLGKMDSAETIEAIRESITYSEGDLIIDSVHVRDQEAYKEPLTIDLYYHVQNLLVLAPDETVFRTGGLFAPISDLGGEIDAEHRQNPIRISYDQQYEKIITIRYPAEWSLTTPLENVTFENAFGLISSTCETGAGVVTVRQQAVLKRMNADRSRAGELAMLIGNRSRLDIPTLVFRPGETQASPAEPGAPQ